MLLAAALFESIEQIVGRGETRRAGPADNPRLDHGGAGRGVRHFEIKRQLLIGNDSHQEDANGIGEGQTHGGERFGGLSLNLLVQADMNHGG
jgi:hypothetical protein